MLSQAQRTAILELHAKGVSRHEISRTLQISRATVRKVLRTNSANVPEIQRKEKAEPYRQQILDLLASCKGNLVRVHEELRESGAEMSYQALRWLPTSRNARSVENHPLYPLWGSGVGVEIGIGKPRRRRALR